MKGCSHKELDKDNYQQYTTAISTIATQDQIFYMFEKT